MKLFSAILVASLCAFSYADFISDCPDYHAKYRDQVEDPELTWNTTLADAALAYAQQMAETDDFKHSTNRVHVGENISYGTARTHTIEDFVDGWGAEKEFFIPGKNYPDCERPGSKHGVGHFTQMVWRNTLEVGSGAANSTSSGRTYFVCQYYPSGNHKGDPIY